MEYQHFEEVRAVLAQMADAWELLSIKAEMLQAELKNIGYPPERIDHLVKLGRDDPEMRSQVRREFAPLRRSLEDVLKLAWIEARAEGPPPKDEPS